MLAVKDVDTKYIFQGVGMLFTGGISEFEWGPDEKRECRFVFIGRNLDEKELIDGVMACKVTEDASVNKRFECAVVLPCWRGRVWLSRGPGATTVPRRGFGTITVQFPLR